MVRLNLQLFAKLNTKESVVDYLKSQGKDSSMSARKEIAKSLGISNYKGSESQNIQMLNALKNQASNTKKETPKAETPKATPASTPASAPASTPTTQTLTPISGVDQSLVDTINSTYSQSDTVTSAQNEANAYKDKLKEISSVTDIIDQKTWDALNTQFSASSAYQEAMNYTNGLLEQLSTGRTSYTDQIKDMMAQIQNREDFQYDISKDTMFQQSLANAMASGQSAMQSTIGQASALTGGYASTYATSAGNQAYNAYIQDAYNNLPEYYNMALESYQMEGQEMYNQLAMLNEADATEYQRLYDSWNANFTNAQNMYAQEYGAWQDSVNNAYNSANLQLNEYGQLYDQTYNTYNALQSNANTLYAQEYQQWQDKVNTALNYANMQNSDYWSNQNFIEGQRQFDESLAWDKEALAKQMAQDQAQFDASLAQDNAQFYASLNAKKSSGSGSGSRPNLEKNKNSALEAYSSGGERGLERYIASLSGDIDDAYIDEIIDYAIQYGNPSALTKFSDGWRNFTGTVNSLLK